MPSPDPIAQPLPPTTTRAAARTILSARLRALGVEEADREATLLLTNACALRPIDLISAPEAPLGEAAPQLEAFAARRSAGEPLSRILGRREFWSLDFTISPEVLDPRPDTETIVEAALEAFAERRSEPLSVLDLGVGSGALLAALLTEFPRARGLGVDRSEAAARIARANIEALGLAARAEIRLGNWTEGLEEPFDLIVSNPPYIRSGDIAGLAREVRDHDPHLALDGGADGLAAYRALAPAIAPLLAPQGWFFLEVGAGQAGDVEAIASEAGLTALASFVDLAGVARVVAGRGPDR